MTRTAVIFSPKYYKHNPGRRHPESARRLGAIMKELKHGALGKSRNWQFVEPRKARVEDVELVHDAEYIRFVEDVCRAGGGLLDLGDTVASPQSFEVALYAVGGTLRAVNLVIKNKFENAFALVRPPGHHAGRFQACGFCIFNNVAIAARYLLERVGLKRILVLDIDAHHGNGTQETFYETSKVLYMSIHQDPRLFPGTGFIDEVGKGEGAGYKVNVPLPFGTDDQVYLKALKEIIVPIARQYKPQFVLISAGLDGHYTDPVANLSLTTACYETIFQTIIEVASRTCKGKLVAALEGGYSQRAVGKIAAAAIARMSGAAYAVNDTVPVTAVKTRKLGERIIDDAKKVQRSFWKLN